MNITTLIALLQMTTPIAFAVVSVAARRIARTRLTSGNSYKERFL